MLQQVHNKHTQKVRRTRQDKTIPCSLFPVVTSMLQSVLIGKITQDTQCDKLKKVLAGYFRYESQLLSDVLDEIFEQDQEMKDVIMAKCLNLPKIEKILVTANVMLKRCQKISDKKWLDEVSSSFADLVW